jgi:hypothetical protein
MTKQTGTVTRKEVEYGNGLAIFFVLKVGTVPAPIDHIQTNAGKHFRQTGPRFFGIELPQLAITVR